MIYVDLFPAICYYMPSSRFSISEKLSTNQTPTTRRVFLYGSRKDGLCQKMKCSVWSRT